MKTKITLASIAAIVIIIIISCNLFKSKPKAFDLQGEWTIDSIENKGSDSSNNLGSLVLALAAKDSMPVGIQFNADSTFRYTHVSDSTKGQYYLSGDGESIFMKEDSVTHQLRFLQKSDSAIALSTIDSVYYYLRRK